MLGGAAVALLAGLAIAGAMLSGQRHEPAQAPPASSAGLVIDSSGPDDGKMDPAKPLRCFVAGQFVGELTLADCAKRNGVATDALDVGLDETGALAAADQAGAVLTPLPPETDAPQAAGADDAAGGAMPLPVKRRWAAACATTRANGPGFRATSASTPASRRCSPAVASGRGGATYGRWMQQTLRLVPGAWRSRPTTTASAPWPTRAPAAQLHL